MTAAGRTCMAQDHPCVRPGGRTVSAQVTGHGRHRRSPPCHRNARSVLVAAATPRGEPSTAGVASLGRQRSTSPRTQVTVPPPTQIVAVVVLGDDDPAGAAERRPLAGHVRRRDPAGAQQPLGQRGVEAARSRDPRSWRRPWGRRRAPRWPGEHPPDRGRRHRRRDRPGWAGRPAPPRRWPAARPPNPGPLSTHWASTMSSRSMPRSSARWICTSSSTGPERTRGGAAKKPYPSSRTRIGINPAAHSCTACSASSGVPPASRQACQVPSVGWPANGSSRTGVKMRTR